jgi:dGTPase
MQTPSELFQLRANLDEAEAQRLSPRAALSREAVRRRPDSTADRDHRQNFAIDVDRILHSQSYTRYIDKTQVFYLVKNDHITHRVLHVQIVSRVSRTIGRHLGLNEDLIEAVALGHDLGHAPFGHDGEAILSDLCREHGVGCFVHAVQSVDFLEHLEKEGRGLNLSLQTLDGILSHDGEVDLAELRPRSDKSFLDLDRTLADKRRNPDLPITPMTAEGCVVRLADTISYIGRDFEDGIRLGLVKRPDLPRSVSEVLGQTNGSIVYNLVADLITASRSGPEIAFSPETARALIEMKNFNRKNIYLNPRVKTQGGKIRELFRIIFERLLSDLEAGRDGIPAFSAFLKDMPPEYTSKRPPAEIVRDFMAGMTDDYFLRLGRHLLLPEYRESF